MPAEIKQGLLVKTDNKFYYLESGPVTTRNSIDRLRSVLIRRGLIDFQRTDSADRKPPYKVMTLEEAESLELEIVTIYLNANIQKAMEAEKAIAEDTGSPWGKL